MSKSLGSTAGGLVAILFGFLGSIIGSDYLRLALQSSPKPQEIRCADLCAKGPGKNAHVTLTDFTPLWDDFFVSIESQNGTWGQVRIPVAPRRAGGPRPRDGSVVVVLNGVRNEKQLKEVLAGGQLTGLIKGRTVHLSDDDLDENPRAEAALCWQLIEGEKPATVSAAAGGVIGAVLLAGMGLFLLVWGRSGADGNQVQHSILFMSPLLFIIDALCGMFQGFATSSRSAAIHLGVVGSVITGIGAHLLITDGLYSVEGFSFNLGLGALLVDIGFGLLLLAGYHALQGWFVEPPEPVAAAASAATEPRPSYRGPIGVGLVGLGFGLFVAAGCWLTQGAPSVNAVAGLIGGGVTGCIIGVTLLMAARSPAVASEDESLGS